MKAWIFQDRKQLAKLGDDCPWSVGWYDPSGKRKGKSIGSKSAAEKHRRKIEGQLAAGVYEDAGRKRWDNFEAEFESKVMAGMEPGTRESAQYALEPFQADHQAGPDGCHQLENDRRLRRGSPARKEVQAGRIAPRVPGHDQQGTAHAPRDSPQGEAAGDILPRFPSLNFCASRASCRPTFPPRTSPSCTRACDSARRPHLQGCEPADWWRAMSDKAT